METMLGEEEIESQFDYFFGEIGSLNIWAEFNSNDNSPADMLFSRFTAAVKPGLQSAFLGKCKAHLHYSEVNLITLECLLVYSGRHSGAVWRGSYLAQVWWRKIQLSF
jgi:hypothetical protein